MNRNSQRELSFLLLLHELPYFHIDATKQMFLFSLYLDDGEKNLATLLDLILPPKLHQCRFPFLMRDKQRR